MSIKISEIVSVTPRLIKAGQTGLELNGVFLTDNVTVPVETPLQFSTLAAVGEYFGATSDEYKAAAVYFNGYDNSFKKPANVYFYRYSSEALAPFIRGGELGLTMAGLRALSGEITLMLGTYEGTVTVDFAGVSTQSDIAEILQTAINANTSGGTAWTNATVTYSSQFNAFTITGGSAGVTEGVTYAEVSDVATGLALTSATGAVLSQGADGATPTETMNTLITMTDNFVSFTTLQSVSDDEVLEFNAWAKSTPVRYLYVVWAQGAALTNAQATEDIGSKLLSANSATATAGTTAVYGDYTYAAFLMGMIASVDFTRSTITTMFKSSSMLTPNISGSQAASALRAKGFNYYGDYAENNTQFTFFVNGSMYGSWAWIDTYINAIWLNANIQLSLITLLNGMARLPYNELGYTAVRSSVSSVLETAVDAGVIDRGISLSAAQISQVNQEAGAQIDESLVTNGYVLQVEDPGATVRAARGTPECSLWYTYGGSIHKIDVVSTAVE